MPRTDFNGDGRDDIIWQNLTTGDVRNWLGQPNGGFIFNEAAEVDSWSIGTLVGIGDFNADGRSDTLWRQDNGELFMSLTDPDGAFYFWLSLGFVKTVPTNWDVVGVGDFNGDGRDDILWRSDTGVVTNWLDQANYVFTNNHVNTGQAIPNDWTIVGTGDFNGDGYDDVLWRHENGTVTNWLGQANGGFANNHSNTGQMIPTDWVVAGIGDFNGDGLDDLLWRYHQSGLVTDWLGQADGGFINNHSNTGLAISWDWQVVGTGDYNGDGRDDILWRHQDGTVTDWLGQTDGGFTSNSAVANYAVDNSWQILGFSQSDYATSPWDY